MRNLVKRYIAQMQRCKQQAEGVTEDDVTEIKQVPHNNKLLHLRKLLQLLAVVLKIESVHFQALRAFRIMQ